MLSSGGTEQFGVWQTGLIGALARKDDNVILFRRITQQPQAGCQIHLSL